MNGKQINFYGTLENIVMLEEDWSRRWGSGQIGFHDKNVCKDLLKHEEKFLKSRGRVFVPLCGKSVDLKYLTDKGHEVIGCEFSENPIITFFNENSIKFERSLHNTAPYEIFKATNKQLAIYKGDIFSLTSDVIGKFDAVWDRSSFVAIHPTQRSNYSKVMHELMKVDARYLLNTCEHNGDEADPFSITDEIIQDIYGASFNIDSLEKYKNEDVGFDLNKAGLRAVFERNTLMSLK